MKMSVDDRGLFTKLVHTEDCGQISINNSKPGIKKVSIGIISRGNCLL